MITEQDLKQELRKIEPTPVETTVLEKKWLNCDKCSTPVIDVTHTFNEGLCDRCFSFKRIGEGKEIREKARMEERMANWDLLCPELYRKGDISFIDSNKFSKVMRWKFGQMGLLICGDSRKGKTTSAWHLLHNQYVLQGHSFMAISEPEFSIEREKHARNYSVDTFLNKCIYSEIFFLDDIGHAASTAKHMEELYYIIEKRTSWKRPIIATTNFTLDEMEQKSGKYGSAKTAKAILNRINSFCYKIDF